MLLSKSCAFAGNEVGELASGTGASGLADVLKPSNSVGIYTVCQSITRYA